LIFGKDRDKGVRVRGMIPEVVQLGNGVDESELAVHRQDMENTSYAYMLSRMMHPEFPQPFGILRSVKRPSYTEMLTAQVKEARSAQEADLVGLLHSSDTWVVE
jgi:2-oxoglutarate ferredoxin oxidoreductase subunit beta